MEKYDAIVIGSGQGGNPLAHKLADLDWQVALIEKEHLGGSCINYGCTPTKTMIASARAAHEARQAAALGVEAGEVTVDLAKIVARKDDIVAQWRSGQQEQVEKRPSLHLYRGHGRFTAPHTVAVDGEELTAEHIFINTGARARIPNIEGLADIPYLTNRSIMTLTAVPPHLLILGGSYLGLEFGQMFRRFGSQVTVVEINERIIAHEDKEISVELQKILEDEGMTFHLAAKAVKVVAKEGGLELTIEYESGYRETLAGSHLLLAAGRVPNTADLGLEAAGVETDAAGHVKTNDQLQTNVPGIWAIGDVKGGPAFTHISYDDHLVIYDNLINDKNRSIAGRIVPYALFTDPELGRVGLSEKAARQAGYDVNVGTVPMAHVARAIEANKTAGLMKIVIDADTDRILGAAILATQGGELVQTLMALMMADAPWTLFKDAIFIHPTLSEGFFSLMSQVE